MSNWSLPEDLTFPLEDNPTEHQKTRLKNWLRDLKTICQQYDLIIAADYTRGELRIVDGIADTTIGIGLAYQFEEGWPGPDVSALDCEGSILDGVWLVRRDGNLVEQREGEQT